MMSEAEINLLKQALVEQQMLIEIYIDALRVYEEPYCNIASSALSKVNGKFELNKLLAAAKEEGRKEAVESFKSVGMFVSYEECDDNFKPCATHYIEANSEELKANVAIQLYAAAPKPQGEK